MTKQNEQGQQTSSDTENQSDSLSGAETDADSEAQSSDSEASTSASEGANNPLTDVPFGQLLQEQQDGVAVFGQPRQKTAIGWLKVGHTGSRPVKKTFKRDNKNRPAEQSSKKPVARLREVIQAPSRRSRDPRFDDMAGNFREEAFKKRYSFIFDEQLPQDKAELKKVVKKTKNPARKKDLQGDLTRIEQQIRAEQEQRRRKEVETAAKAKEKEAVKAGKKPFFLKKGEKKRQELIRRYQDLKATGRLQKVLAKKRKKNAAKDHRYLPSARRE